MGFSPRAYPWPQPPIIFSSQQLLKKGFTLIELLVVVLIIGILAAVALPQYTKAVERSRTSEAVQALGDLATAQSIYYMQHGNFADAITGSTSNPARNLNDGDITFPTTLSKSFNIKVDSTSNGTNGGIMKAQRNGGMYNGAILQIKVDKSGAIEKKCKEATTAGFCGLVEAAGYTTKDTSLEY